MQQKIKQNCDLNILKTINCKLTSRNQWTTGRKMFHMSNCPHFITFAVLKLRWQIAAHHLQQK